MKIDVTPAQLKAIQQLTDDCESMLGAGEEEADAVWNHHIQLIDRMLEKNGRPRTHCPNGLTQ